jgi:hypothetical protein
LTASRRFLDVIDLVAINDHIGTAIVELDGAIARSRSLELANDEAARRLSGASAKIREVLAGAAGLSGKG